MTFLKAIARYLLAGLIGLLFLLMAMEWAVGCGETYTDSKGVVHSNECIFINK